MKLAKIAQNQLFSLRYGPVWRGVWERGHIERNRKLYDFELVVFLEGSSVVTTEAGRFVCRAPSALVIPPGISHATAATSRVERGCVHFCWFGETMPEEHWVFGDDPVREFHPEKTAAFPETGVPFPWFIPELPAELRTLGRRFFLRDGESPAERLDRTGILYCLLGGILDLVRDSGPGARVAASARHLLKTKHRIERDFTDPHLCVRRIAGECGITPTHLARIFRQGTGVAVKRYVRQLKIARAKELLKADNNLTIKEISDVCGFDDPNFFSRVFKIETGFSPGEFRFLRKAD
ncbi:MAG: AraC family transcriptional regulator [Victivallaceae bacterium]|nr:AraC family transcriptional regulator [Victivallaceae bacterium]